MDFWAAESRTRSSVLRNLAFWSYQIALVPSKLNPHAESDSRTKSMTLTLTFAMTFLTINVQRPEVLEIIRLCNVVNDGVALCRHSPKVEPCLFSVSHAVVWKITSWCNPCHWHDPTLELCFVTSPPRSCGLKVLDSKLRCKTLPELF